MTKISNKLVNKSNSPSCTYKQLQWYLEHKHSLPLEEREKFKDLVDNYKDCWDIWNKVRWDAAMESRGVQELKEYLKGSFEPYFDSSWALANEWNNKKRISKDSVEDFYKHTPHYMYNSTIFYESKDRMDFHLTLKELIEKYEIKSAIDYGCGVGNDGLKMIEEGVNLTFVDFSSPSVEFLKWRLKKRKIPRKKYQVIDVRSFPELDINAEMFWSIDVIEHMIEQTEIFEFIPESVRLAVYFTDDDEEAGQRHPFHFKINTELLDRIFTDLGFRKIPNNLLTVWYRDSI